MNKFIWPVLRFWRFTPWAFILACVWNCFEIVGKPMPFAPYAFGVICGHKGKKVNP